MSQESGLQRPLFFLLLLILLDSVHLSFVAEAMRPYPTFIFLQFATPQTQKPTHTVSASAALSSLLSSSPMRRQTDNSAVSTLPAHHLLGANNQILDCGNAASSPHSDCARSPAPEGAAGSEIDPRYGVEKRLVPTGPNPLHN